MKKSLVLSLLFTICFLLSCSTTYSVIKKNRILTNKEVSILYKKNGNAFYISSANSNFSIVWSYDEDSVEIYRLKNGVIEQKQVYKEIDKTQYSGFSLVDIETDLYQKCALELDGDAFGFRIDDDGKIYKADFAVDINCLKRQKYKSVFLNKLINDINYYRMWEVQPQKSS